MRVSKPFSVVSVWFHLPLFSLYFMESWNASLRLYRFTLSFFLFCHCERSEAISLLLGTHRDCFVAIAPRKDTMRSSIMEKQNL